MFGIERGSGAAAAGDPRDGRGLDDNHQELRRLRGGVKNRSEVRRPAVVEALQYGA